MSYLFSIIIYIFVSYTFFRIAEKTETEHSWLAFIPFVRLWLIVRIAGKSWKWFVYFMIPILNIFITWIVWGEVAKRLGRSPWWGRTMVVPFWNLIVLAVLAFEIHLPGHVYGPRDAKHE